MAPNDTGINRDVPVTGIRAFIITSCLVVALYNFIELNFIILTTFKRRDGLYFWSFVAATWGIAPYTIGFLLKNFQVTTNSHVYVTLIVVGWWPMVTGQSMVLYSRLHLILHHSTGLRAVLSMIIFNAIVCHLPTTVLVYGSNSDNPDPFIGPYSIYERIQVTVFVIQEMIISGVYILETTKMLRVTSITSRGVYLNMLRHLLAVSTIVALLDTAILAFEYAGLYDLQTSYKVMAYSLKLKIEFSILNRLVDVLQSRKGSSCPQTTEHCMVELEIQGESGIGTEIRPAPRGRAKRFSV
ncbi:hypothetical protein B0T10DRAFT_590883 [Thelonectria olida]|uniref:DUF7703 domain-containing protein n=1 Tax=Thelonectria olida TaxID=1576542 RepID=A0A9P9AIT4_9HYPO|nr:hypothetical protein B0T10DRAFT_590883 [Thelonectria olida]